MNDPHQPSTPNRRTATSHQPSADDDQTWLEFLRSAGGTVPSQRQPNERQNSTSSTLSADRKRRLTSADMTDNRREYPYNHATTAAHPMSRHQRGSDGGGFPYSDGRSRQEVADIAARRVNRDGRPELIVGSPPGARESGQMVGREGQASYVRLGRTNSHELPRWQPDEEVVDCTVCGNPFTLLNRRHHCRKCGRVVCKPCSPHKITIPRPFIVRPPGFYEEETGGGEEVRVCKPCVPDPWVPPRPQAVPPPPPSSRPPPPPPPFLQSHPGHRNTGAHRSLNFDIPARGERSSAQPLPHATARYRSNTHHSHSAYAPPQPASGFASSVPTRTSSIHYQNLPSGGSALSRQLHQHRMSQGNIAPFIPSLPPMGSRPLPPDALQRAQQAPRPKRQIKEEDECPVCHLELPHGEQARETHIVQCIESNTAGGTGTPPPPRPVQSAPPAAASSPEGIVASSSTPPQPQAGNRPRATSYRPSGMLVFRATEKDCTDGDGNAQECVICMEEFEESDEMGRMECWCKFHRTCIRGWWERKGFGSCPTHQLQE